MGSEAMEPEAPAACVSPPTTPQPARVAAGVALELAVVVGEDVGLLLGVCDAVETAVRVLVLVAVPDALAPYVRLLVGVYETCGQKHMGR